MSIFKTVLLNNGQGLDHTDLNNMQRFSDARLNDQILRELRRQVHMLSADMSGSEPEGSWRQLDIESDKYIWALTGGGGFARPSTSVALTTVARAGTIYQWTDVPDGTDPKFLAYTLDDAEFTLLHGVGHATLDRIDLIEVQLSYVDGTLESRDFEDSSTGVVTSQSMNTTRRVQCSAQIKAGTPAASPLYPTPTAGYGVLAAVYVPATHNAVFARTDFIDTRIPIGAKIYDVPAFNMDIGGQAAASRWAISTAAGERGVVSKGDSSDFVLCYPPVSGQTTRVMGIGLGGIFPAGANVVRLVRLTWTGGSGPTITELCDLTTPLTGTSWALRWAAWDDLMTYSSGTDRVGGKNASFALGDAFWTSGRRNGIINEFYNFNPVPSNTYETLALYISGVSLSTVATVRWLLATGL